MRGISFEYGKSKDRHKLVKKLQEFEGEHLFYVLPSTAKLFLTHLYYEGKISSLKRKDSFFGVSHPIMYYYVSILRDVGVVQSTKKGLSNTYELTDKGYDVIEKVLERTR